MGYIAVVSLYTFVSPLASSTMAPALSDVAHHFHIGNPTIVALTLSIYLLAYAFGPLILAPLSEIYGRTIIYHMSILTFLCFNIGCAFAPNTAALIIFRFLAGLSGSSPVVLCASSVSDMFNERERAFAMAVATMGPLIGPVAGPVIGGFLTQAAGYRWIFLLLAILSGASMAIGIPLLHETYAPLLAYRRMLATGDLEKAAAISTMDPNRSSTRVMWISLSRPIMLLTRSLICFSLSLYMALIYGFLYLLFTAFPDLFSETYGWGPGVAGLAYLGPGVGFLIATGSGGILNNKIYIKLSDKNGGVGKPEYRIPLMILGACLSPIGLFWYGWSAHARLHWIMPIIGAGIFGAGMMYTFLPSQLYLVDSFTYAASVIAAAAFIRSLFGFIFPLFGEQLFASLGVGGASSLLAGLAIVVGLPFPIWLWFYGERMRARGKLTK